MGILYIDDAGYAVQCDECGESFRAERRTARYCSGACRKAASRARQLAAEWAKLNVPIGDLRMLELFVRTGANCAVRCDEGHTDYVACLSADHITEIPWLACRCGACLLMAYPPASVLDELGPSWYRDWREVWRLRTLPD